MSLFQHRGTLRSGNGTQPWILLVGLAATAAQAATYYVDPATGSMTNNGTSTAPWSTMQAVFSAGKTFAAGDVLYLRNGYHGAPTVTGLHSSGTVTIQPQSGHVPKLKTLTVNNASGWLLSGFDISPANAGVTLTNADNLVYLKSNCSLVTIQNCAVHSVADSVDVTQWAAADWAAAANGMRCDAPQTTLRDNTFAIVNFGIALNRTATGSLVTGNVISDFSKDGMRGLANSCTFSYNRVMNSYLGPDIDANHDDGFQSWSVGTDGTVGTGTVSNITLRGNTFISFTDPDQPLKGAMQGIGCFDGMFKDWVVENNLILTNSQWHAISLYGAINCRVVNNTAVKHPLDGSTVSPWVGIFAHKNGTPASGNTIRNNLSTSLTLSGTYTADHNITTTAYTSHFADYPGFDFHLKSTSTAVNAGSTTLAPAIDLDQYSRSAPYDVGCYEYQPGNVHGGNQSLRALLSSTASFTNTWQAPTGIATGTTYVASVWIRGEGSVMLSIRAGSWGATLATMRCTATSTWTQCTSSAFSTGTNTKVTFVVQDQYGQYGTGTVYLDDAFLGVSGGANKLANPGFESGTASWNRGTTSVWSVGSF